MRIFSSVVYRLPFILGPFFRPQTNITSGSKKRGHVTRYYIWGPNGLVSHIDSDGVTTHYYHADEQGSTLALTDGNGNITDRFGYSPYGELTARSGTNSTPYQWLGGLAVRADDGTNTYAMLHRFYSADEKRFLSADPKGIDGWVNLYAYGNLNPTIFNDPYGLGVDSSSSSMFSEMLGGAAASLGLPGGNQNAFWQDQANQTQLNNAMDAQWQGMSTGNKLLSTFAPPAYELEQGNYGRALASTAIMMLPMAGPNGAPVEGEPLLPTAVEATTAADPLLSGQNQAVFWSGIPKGPAAAAQWASQNGGVTLEQTLTANGIQLPPWDPGNPASVTAWTQASQNFAAGASGNVRVLQGNAVSVQSVWGQTEFNALTANPNVTSITAVNPQTGAQVLLWSR